MSYDWLRLQCAKDGVRVPARRTFFGVPGTWAQFDAGFQADLARSLDDEKWYWQGVNYAASFGPLNPPPWAPTPTPSYNDSVLGGVANTVQLINAIPGPFILSGYSQGAEVVGRVRYELVAGSLQHRAKDCLLSITFGDPARQASDESYGGGAGTGISRFVIPPCPFRCVTYAVTGDMYCTLPNDAAGDDMHAVYEALTSLGGTVALTDLVNQVMKILKDPIAGGYSAVEAIIRAMKVGAHGTYGPFVDHAAGIVNSLEI